MGVNLSADDSMKKSSPKSKPSPRTLRLRAPEGCTSVSLAGREFAVKDGVVAVPAELAAILVHAHGFAYAD